MKRVITLVSALSLVGLTGCDAMSSAVRSKANQGMVLGGLLGAGVFTAIGSVSGHHSKGIGMWSGSGAALGAIGGWFLGHTMEEQRKTSQ